MPAIGCQQDQNKKVGDQQRQIEAVERIKAQEGFVEEVCAKIMADTARRC